MKQILITGSSGFVGSYFLKHYSSQHNIKSFSFLKDDFQALSLEDITSIVHLSALVHQMGGASAEEYEKVNVIQTLELANKAKKTGVEHFIFMSTVKVYGEETDLAYSENSVCIPEDDYGKSKLQAEQELQKLEDDNFKVSIIRTPIVYGYGVKANIKNLINLISKVPILPFRDINNKRSMVYIGNLSHLIDVLLAKKQSGIFLASDDSTLTTSKLIQLISKELNKKTILIKMPFFETLLKYLKPSFHQRLYGSLEVNNNLTKQILEYENLYTTEDGIECMIHGESK